MPTTIYIVGPTASGKTALAIDIACILDGEIICADSQTVRRGLDIGTAKPSIKEMAGVKHYMLDIIGPYDDYSLALFQKQSKSHIQDIYSRNKLPIIVGGTGLYIDSLYYNYTLPNFAGSNPVAGLDPAKLSVEELQEQIIDAGFSMPENSKNKRHLVNVLIRAGRTGDIAGPDKNSLIVGIDPGREELIGRINTRVENMFSYGFIEEVKSIIDTYGPPPRSFGAIGYRIVMRMLNGEIVEQEAKELFKIADRQYAKRQISWFKRNKHITWFESPEAAKDYILNICKK